LERLLWSVIELEDDNDGNAWPSNIELVCLLPARKQLSKQAVVQLLHAAVRCSNKCMMRGLCRLKIARKLDLALMQQVQAALWLPAATPPREVYSDAEAVE
jgi:hypothetical protein